MQLAADDHERRQRRLRKPRARATTAPIAGRAEPADCLAAEVDAAPAVLPVRPMVPATPWSFEAVCSERRMAKLVGEVGDLREQLADADAGDLRGDGRERAAELERRGRLGVPGVELRRPAPQPEQDDRLALGQSNRRPAWPAAEQVGQRQAQDAAGADLQEGPAGQPLAGALPVCRPMSSMASPGYAVRSSEIKRILGRFWRRTASSAGPAARAEPRTRPLRPRSWFLPPPVVR